MLVAEIEAAGYIERNSQRLGNGAFDRLRTHLYELAEHLDPQGAWVTGIATSLPRPLESPSRNRRVLGAAPEPLGDR